MLGSVYFILLNFSFASCSLFFRELRQFIRQALFFSSIFWILRSQICHTCYKYYIFLHCNPAYSTVDWGRYKPYKDINTQKKIVGVPMFMKLKADFTLQVFLESVDLQFWHKTTKLFKSHGSMKTWCSEVA